MVVSVVARLPMAMLSIGLLVHTEHLTGSLAAAGIVAGAFALSLGVGGPLLGRLADRRGQTTVLIAGALVAGSALLVTAVLPVGAPLAALVALAAALGLSAPPVGACLRAILPAVVGDGDALRTAYAAESAAIELTWVSGPPPSCWSRSRGPPAPRWPSPPPSWWPEPRCSRPSPRRAPGGPQRRPSARAAARCARRPCARSCSCSPLGVVFGTVEVAVVAAADALGSAAAAGPLLGIWGAGSLVGGVIAARMGGGARTGAGLALVLAALAAGHLALAAAAGSAVALAAVLALAGATIAPTYASVYAMVDRAAPAGTVTEAFAWLNTAVAIGASAGAACAGAVADAAGPAPTFALAGAAGAAAALIAALRARPLSEPAHPIAAPASA